MRSGALELARAPVARRQRAGGVDEVDEERRALLVGPGVVRGEDAVVLQLEQVARERGRVADGDGAGAAHHHRLEVLAAHHGAGASAPGLVVLVGGEAGEGDELLAGGARGEDLVPRAHLLAHLLLEGRRLETPEAALGRQEVHPVVLDEHEHRVRRPAGHDHHVVAGELELRGERAADVGVEERPGRRALAAHGEARARRRGGAGERAAGEDERVLRSERVGARRELGEEVAEQEALAADVEPGPVLVERLDRRRQGGQVEPQHASGVEVHASPHCGAALPDHGPPRGPVLQCRPLIDRSISGSIAQWPEGDVKPVPRRRAAGEASVRWWRPGGWSTDGDGLARLTDHLHFAFEDPLSSLPETAQNLLVAAKEIVADEGFEALTLKTVSERAGENKAMVSYYFDNKAGLIAAVLDSVIHDEYLDSLDRMKDVAPGERIPRLVEEMRRMAASVEDFQVFYELLPHVLRDEVLRRRMAMLFRWYWKMKLEWLGVRRRRGRSGRPRPAGRRPAPQRRHRRARHPGRRRPRHGPRQPLPGARADARVARGGRRRPDRGRSARRRGLSRGSRRRAAAGPPGPGRPAARTTPAAP